MPGPLRIDRWLWYTRFYKTRGLAAEAVKAGHVKVNEQRAKPARDVKEGDVLAITKGDVEYEVRIDRIPERRGPAPEAQGCYTESEASAERRRQEAERRSQARTSAPTPGRPDKRTRRLLRDRHRSSS